MAPSLLNKRERAGIGFLGALFLVLAIATWDRLGDLLIDYPHELYSIYLVSEWYRLPYREFFYVYGPLSLIVNALAFKLLGVHNHTIQGLNLAWALLACSSLWVILAAGWTPLQASIALATFLVMSIFSALPLCTNFNFIAPYTLAVPLGMTLALTCLATSFAALSAKCSRRLVITAFVAGSCSILTGLTKPEIAGACWITVGLTMLGAWYLAQWCLNRMQVATTLRFMGWGALMTVVLCLGITALFYDLADFFLCPAAAFLAISTQALGGVRQQGQLGMDAPWANLVRCVVWAVASLSIFLAAVSMGMLVKSQPASQRQERMLLTLVFLPFPIFAVFDPELAKVLMLKKLPYGLPLLTAICWIFAGLALLRVRRTPPQMVEETNRTLMVGAPRSLFVLAWGTFSGLLLSRMVLNARLYDYGFYQAVPALLFCSLTAWNSAQRLFAASPQAQRIFHTFLAGFFAAGLFLHARESILTLREKTFLVERPHLRLYTLPPPQYPNAAALLAATDGIARRMKENPHDSFAAVPAGSIVHYLTGIPNPTPYHQIGPYEVGAIGERAIVETYDALHPTYIVLIHRPYFGFPPLLTEIFFSWLHQNYQMVTQYGETPFSREDSYGVQIWQIKSLPPPTGAGSNDSSSRP